jgi:tRNA (guanine6-N2)-methyltransferase
MLFRFIVARSVLLCLMSNSMCSRGWNHMRSKKSVQAADVRARQLHCIPAGYASSSSGDLRVLFRLRSVVAAYLIVTYDVPRPRALLGHQHLTRLLTTLELVRSLTKPEHYRTLRLSAAGSDSSVMTRLKETLAAHTGLALADDEGDLLIRLRRAESNGGWEVLVRLSPRPLATRAWRVCNRPGALNATLASVMMRLTRPSASDRVLNLACGSGTLLIERLFLAPARLAIGCDPDQRALQCARRNLEAAGFAPVVRLEPWDATSLPLETRSASM